MVGSVVQVFYSVPDFLYLFYIIERGIKISLSRIFDLSITSCIFICFYFICFEALLLRAKTFRILHHLGHLALYLYEITLLLLIFF